MSTIERDDRTDRLNLRPPFAIGALAGVLVLAGCSGPPASHATAKHEGPKVNIPSLIANPTAYKGKTISLTLKVDEAIARGKGESLRDYVGKEAKFMAAGPKGEKLNLVVKIPPGLTVPEVGKADEVRVTFICTRGSLRQGNEAKSIELP
jgi:hypothetical protein